MPALIKDKQIVSDQWAVVAKDAALPSDEIATGQALLLPLALWLQHRNELSTINTVGIWIDSDEEPAQFIGDDAAITQQLKALPVIAINFPVFSDGRGYSYARQLRDQFGFGGELRAIGDVLKDQLFFYQRCGFNSFAARADRDIDQALNSLNDFSVCYQATNDSAMPAFKKR